MSERRTHRKQLYPKSEQGEAAKEAIKAQPRAAASNSRAGTAQAAVLVPPAGQNWGARGAAPCQAPPANPSAPWGRLYTMGLHRNHVSGAGDRQAGGDAQLIHFSGGRFASGEAEMLLGL